MPSSQWSVIAESEIQQEFTSSEQQVLAAVNAADQLPAILARTVNRFRAVIDNAGYSLGMAATIPDSCRQHVVAMARWLWLVSLPKAGEQLQTKPRSEANDRAEKNLEDISNRKFGIENPSDDVQVWDKAGSYGGETAVVMVMTQGKRSSV